MSLEKKVPIQMTPTLRENNARTGAAAAGGVGLYRRALRGMVGAFFACIVLGVVHVTISIIQGIPEHREWVDAAAGVGTAGVCSVVSPAIEIGETHSTSSRQHQQQQIKSWPTLYMTSAGDALLTDATLVRRRSVPTSPPPYGNGRAVIPLLLTSTKYHGTSLFATTIQGWILKLLIPQGNIDLIVFYDVAKVSLKELVQVLKIRSRTSTTTEINRSATPPVVSGGRHFIDPSLLVDVQLSDADAALLGDGYFLTSYHPTFSFRVHPVRLPFPEYLVATNMTQLADPQWMRCGCPPVCPQKRATVDYIQGTRWYTYDLFLQPMVHPYSFWIKLDVDIWMMREISFNMVDTMLTRGAIFAHTGYIYNGHGCSNELHEAILQYCRGHGIHPVSAGQSWWKQDDTVYYSNFVVSSMAFHLSADHMRLAKALTEYPTGFFKYRWTDQSLFHKVFGVFYGPEPSDFLLDWSSLRCSKKRFQKGAVFYHSKGKKKSSVLRQCTDI